MTPMPANVRRKSFRSCCGQSLCLECDAHVVIRGVDSCPYCRAPGAATSSETVARLRTLIERNPDNKKALSILGDHYKKGDGVEADCAEARRLYERAAALGDPGGTVELGLLYAQGCGVPVDAAEARRYFERAIELGSTVAMHNLAVLLDINGDHAEAKPLFIRAAARGYRDSVSDLEAMPGVTGAELAAVGRVYRRRATAL